MGFCWQEAAADRKQRAAKAATDRAEYERAHARLAEHAERHRLECAAALAIQCAATLFELLAWSIWMLLSAAARDGCRAAGRGYLVRQEQRSARLRSAAAVEIQRGARVWLARQEASRRRNLRDGIAEPVRLLRCISSLVVAFA